MNNGKRKIRKNDTACQCRFAMVYGPDCPYIDMRFRSFVFFFCHFSFPPFRKRQSTSHYIFYIKRKNPFEARYCKFVKEKIIAKKLEKIFSDFVGVHDFKNFRLNDCVSKITIREIYQIEVKYFGENKIKIYIKGSAFLKSQVRIMVGTALEIYYGRLPENQ